MIWTSEYSCRQFHKLSIESKIIKIGVRSKKLWSKHDEANFCGWPDDPTVLEYSDAQNLIKWYGLLDILVENFISFPKSTKSSKTEFGAESNDQNTKHHEADFCGWPDDPTVLGYSDAQNLIKWDGLLDILVENFISFPKSTRSSKTEFGAESND